MIAGVVLSDSLERDTKIAILGDDLRTYSVESNQEIAEVLEDNEVETVAFDVGTEQSQEELTEAEKELKQEGYIFEPNSFNRTKVERLQSLSRRLKHRIEFIELIRFDPQITSKELMIDGEDDLRSFGVEGEIEDVKTFDAVLGAITARFYDGDQYEDLGVIVPESLGEI